MNGQFELEIGLEVIDVSSWLEREADEPDDKGVSHATQGPHGLLLLVQVVVEMVFGGNGYELALL